MRVMRGLRAIVAVVTLSIAPAASSPPSLDAAAAADGASLYEGGARIVALPLACTDAGDPVSDHCVSADMVFPEPGVIEEFTIRSEVRGDD